MYCSQCGKEVDDIAKFCGACGAPMSSASSSSHQIAPVASPVQTTPPPSHQALKPLVGISGWLILVALGLVLTVLFQAYGALESLGMYSDGSVASVSDPTTPEYYVPGFSMYMLLTLLSEVVMMAVAIYLLVLMYQRKRVFPKYYFIFVWSLVVIALLDVLYGASLTQSSQYAETFALAQEEGYASLARSVIAALVWGTYIRVSKRVRNTFIVD